MGSTYLTESLAYLGTCDEVALFAKNFLVHVVPELRMGETEFHVSRYGHRSGCLQTLLGGDMVY